MSSPGEAGAPQGESQPGKPHSGTEQPSGIDSVKQKLNALNDSINSMEGLLDEISESSQNMGQKAGDIGQGVPIAGGIPSDRDSQKIDSLDKSAAGLQDKSNSLGQDGNRLRQGAQNMVRDAFGSEKDLPAPRSSITRMLGSASAFLVASSSSKIRRMFMTL